MYRDHDTQGVKDAVLAALRASIAWRDELVATALYYPHALPETASTYTHGEHNWRVATTELARTAGLDAGAAERSVRNDFLFYLLATTTLERRLDGASLSHADLQALCHDTAAAEGMSLSQLMGMTVVQFFGFIQGLHNRRYAGCDCLRGSELRVQRWPDTTGRLAWV